MPRKSTPKPERPCDCGRIIPAGTSNRITRCDYCRAADPHRNSARKRKELPRIFTSIDTEGAKNPDGTQKMITVSYGREDGSSATLHTQSPVRALKWLVTNCRGEYTGPDGQAYEQVAVAFHFGYDTAVLLKHFTATGPEQTEIVEESIMVEPDVWIDVTKTVKFPGEPMYLVRSAVKSVTTNLCGARHDDGEPCTKGWETLRAEADPTAEVAIKGSLHRFDPYDCELVMTEGGEGDILAYDPTSHLALSSTPGRRLRVELRPYGDLFKGRKVLDIHDTGTAMPGSLEYNIDMWSPELSPAQREIIAWGKRTRVDNLANEDPRKVAAYSEAECVAHARICRMLIDLVKEAAHIQLPEKKLYGSGSVAQAALKHYGTLKRSDSDLGEKVLRYTRDDLSPDQVSLLTYFGGMIEAPVVGMVPGHIDELDINSAYPSKMIDLPCMAQGHGRWVRASRKRGYPDHAVVGHVLASWSIPEEDARSTPPFVVRRPSGDVAQPLNALEPVWVSLAEYRAARERFCGYLTLHEVLYWEKHCDCPNPLAWLGDLYNKRLDVKAAMKATAPDSVLYRTLNMHQYIIKLIINSIYGKLAQKEPVFGTYTNLHYASYITGATRAQVREESWAREDQGGIVVYQHTDSVLSIGGQPVDGGKALGAWGLEDKATEDFLIMQPGLATGLGGGKSATRGCREHDFIRAAKDWYQDVDLTQHPLDWPSMKVEQTIMITRRLAHALRKPELAGSFQPKTTMIRAVSGKRDIAAARQLPGMPTAWEVPPLFALDAQASIGDISDFRSKLEKRLRTGEFDA